MKKQIYDLVNQSSYALNRVTKTISRLGLYDRVQFALRADNPNRREIGLLEMFQCGTGPHRYHKDRGNEVVGDVTLRID